MSPLERAARALRDVVSMHLEEMAPDADEELYFKAARAVLQAIREHYETVQESQDWTAEYGESEAAGVAASKTSDWIALIDAALEEG